MRALLALHHEGMHATSPPGTAYVLDLSGLRGPDITLWSARLDGRVAAVGALRLLGGGVGEVKSMRTHPDHLRLGLAAALLDHIIGVARSAGLMRLSLETGSGPDFAPALALYRTRGFAEGAVFGGYPDHPFSRFLHLTL